MCRGSFVASILQRKQFCEKIISVGSAVWGNVHALLQETSHFLESSMMPADCWQIGETILHGGESIYDPFQG